MYISHNDISYIDVCLCVCVFRFVNLACEMMMEGLSIINLVAVRTSAISSLQDLHSRLQSWPRPLHHGDPSFLRAAQLGQLGMTRSDTVTSHIQNKLRGEFLLRQNL